MAWYLGRAIWSLRIGTGCGDSPLAYLAAFLPMARKVSRSISGDWLNSSTLLSGGRSFWWMTVVPRDWMPIPMPEPDSFAAWWAMKPTSALL